MREHRAGQITIEYFLLLAAIIVVTLVGLSTVTFHTDIRDHFKGLFDSAQKSMPLDDKGPADQNPDGLTANQIDPPPPDELAGP